MGLRGATIFLPLLAAVFVPRRLPRRVAVAAIGLAPLSAVLWAVCGPAWVDPLYVGLVVSAEVLGVGWVGGNMDP